jgi:hypothetical protein
VYWRGDVLENNTRGTSFIVTRATMAIALYLLHTIHPVALQSVWVLTTYATYSTKYSRSSYAPGLSDKEGKTKINKQTNTNYVQKGVPRSRSQLLKE